MRRPLLTIAGLTALLTAACDPVPVAHDGADAGPGIALRDTGPGLADAAADAGEAADGAQPPPPADAGPPAVWLEVCEVSDDLNMRSGPGTSHPVIAQLPLGARVRLLDTDGSWKQVDYQGQTGWCYDTYLCAVAAPDGGAPPADSGPPPTGSGSPGPAIGQLWNTFYYLAVEGNFSGAKETVLYDAQCQPLATVSAAFSDAVCVEGSGKLSNGDLINYAKTCSCGRPCPTGGTVCYKKLPPSAPWGEGAFNNPLQPLRSIAVDKGEIPLGSTVYLKQLDGVTIPAIDGIGGFVHDGCFKADDVGGAIQGSHIDIFAGTEAMWKALEGVLPTKSSIDGFEGGARCSYLE